jgi:hypothetical protein
MSQFDFGTIDPYVVDGVQLADMLNNWRSAVHSWHRGGTRPSYVVPGMMWINDSGGATNWIVNVYMSPTVGDVAMFIYNTSTGAITLAGSAGGTFAAAVLLAQANANPSVQWSATGNPIDAKNWRMTVNAAGALVLASYNDAGVLQQSFTFNRDGTTTNSVPTYAMRLYNEVVLAASAADMRVTVPAAAKAIEIWFFTINGTADTLLMNPLNGAAIQAGNVFRTQYFYGIGATTAASFVNPSTSWQIAGTVIVTNGVWRPTWVPANSAVLANISGYAQTAGGASAYALASSYDCSGIVVPTGYRLSNTAQQFAAGSWMRCFAAY